MVIVPSECYLDPNTKIIIKFIDIEYRCILH